MPFDLAACATPPYTIVIEAPESSAVEELVEDVLSPLHPLHEQLVAITGLGLEIDETRTTRRIETHIAAVRGTALSLSYLSAGDRAGQRIVLIHGSPGLGEEWAAMLADTPPGQYRLAPDRPGFGETVPNAPMERLADQAAALRPLIDTDDGSTAILVGYSYGGPVALRAAIDMPDAVAGLLLVSAAADPTEEEIHPLQALVDLDIFDEIIPDELVNANTELLALKDELTALAPDLAQLRIPVTVVHGLDDSLVPPENVIYLHGHLTAADPFRLILIEDGDHFLPWSHVGQLNEAIACLVADQRRNAP